jgi:hypothetical protein
MEFTIYLDSTLKNVQKVRSRNFDVKVKPRELAEACYPNYYAVSKDGGPLIRNSNRHISSNTKKDETLQDNI